MVLMSEGFFWEKRHVWTVLCAPSIWYENLLFLCVIYF